jgi:hypothetical protein
MSDEIFNRYSQADVFAIGEGFNRAIRSTMLDKKISFGDALKEVAPYFGNWAYWGSEYVYEEYTKLVFDDEILEPMSLDTFEIYEHFERIKKSRELIPLPFDKIFVTVYAQTKLDKWL